MVKLPDCKFLFQLQVSHSFFLSPSPPHCLNVTKWFSFFRSQKHWLADVQWVVFIDIFISVTKNALCDWLLTCQSANEKMCCVLSEQKLLSHFPHVFKHGSKTNSPSCSSKLWRLNEWIKAEAISYFWPIWPSIYFYFHISSSFYDSNGKLFQVKKCVCVCVHACVPVCSVCLQLSERSGGRWMKLFECVVLFVVVAVFTLQCFSASVQKNLICFKLLPCSLTRDTDKCSISSSSPFTSIIIIIFNLIKIWPHSPLYLLISNNGMEGKKHMLY